MYCIVSNEYSLKRVQYSSAARNECIHAGVLYMLSSSTVYNGKACQLCVRQMENIYCRLLRALVVDFPLNLWAPFRFISLQTIRKSSAFIFKYICCRTTSCCCRCSHLQLCRLCWCCCLCLELQMRQRYPQHLTQCLGS